MALQVSDFSKLKSALVQLKSDVADKHAEALKYLESLDSWQDTHKDEIVSDTKATFEALQKAIDEEIAKVNSQLDATAAEARNDVYSYTSVYLQIYQYWYKYE